MRELALAGFIAAAFGIWSYYATDQFGWFGYLNVGFGIGALLVAAAFAARRLRGIRGNAGRVVARGALLIVAALVVAVMAERVAAWSQIQFDWTFEGAFEPSPATLKALQELPEEATATLYFDPADPRVRRTRLLLARIAQSGPLRLRDRIIDDFPQEVDRYGVASSNTVVVTVRERFETIQRPTEGALYEAFYRLRNVRGGHITALRGDGEGDLSRSDDVGYAGLSAALATEGYAVRSVIGGTMTAVPEGTDVLLTIAPRRRLPDTALSAVEEFLAAGGSLVALLEPGIDSGIEDVLALYGIESPDALVVDPGREADAAPLAVLHVLSATYWDHPVCRQLDANRMTYFPGTRAFTLRKPRVEDELERIVDSSGYAWLDPDTDILDGHAGRLERGERKASYEPLVVSGRYRRGAGDTRIVAFGDADFASNAHLRTLYNLDLILNAVHWAAANEPEITLRPKNRPTPVQFPLPLTNTLQTLYGVGLLVPELLLIVGGIVWLRGRRS